MLSAGILSVFALSLAGNGEGYVDNHGRVWKELPRFEDYDAQTWDAEIAHLVFTNAKGNQFQICRRMTPEEEAAAAGMNGLMRQLQPDSGPGGGIRATVNVNVPCDEEYRAYYGSSWQTQANNVIESADNAMYSKYAINCIVRSYNTWDSNDSASIEGLLSEASSEWGYQGQEMMHAFSDDPTPGGAVGIAYLGIPRLVVKRYLSYQDVISQHEMGHTYTLYHCCTTACIMYPSVNPGGFGLYHNYTESCSGQNHNSVMNAQKNRY